MAWSYATRVVAFVASEQVVVQHCSPVQRYSVRLSVSAEYLDLAVSASVDAASPAPAFALRSKARSLVHFLPEPIHQRFEADCAALFIDVECDAAL